VGGRLVLLVIGGGVELRVGCDFSCAMPRRGEWEGILFFFFISMKSIGKKGWDWYFGQKRASGGGARTGVLILRYLSRQPKPFSSPSRKTPSGGSSSSSPSSSSSSPYVFGPFSLHHPVFFSLRSQPTQVLRVA
jgi:hypothetical protein